MGWSVVQTGAVECSAVPGGAVECCELCANALKSVELFNSSITHKASISNGLTVGGTKRVSVMISEGLSNQAAGV